MKYTDRRSIGMEQLLTEQAPLLGDIDDYAGPDGTEPSGPAGIIGANYIPAADRLIGALLSGLRDDYPQAYGRIPEELRNGWLHGDRGGRERRVQDFLSWYTALCGSNERARVERTAELNNFCSTVSRSPSEQSMTRCFFGLNNQRIIIVGEDSDSGMNIVVKAAEREWGRGVFRFTGCTGLRGDTVTRSDPSIRPALTPLPGFLYCFEGTVTADGSFHVEMLIDSSFGGEEYPGRLLSDDGWHEIGFDCTGVDPEPVFYDYAGRMQRMGTPRFELIERCCALLVSKSEILDGCSLTEDERAFLPAAQLIRGTGALIDRDGSDSESHYMYLVFRALDNRYAMRRLCGYLEACGCAALKKELEGTMDSFDRGDDEDAVIKRAISLRGRYESDVAAGNARPLLALLSDKAVEMTSGLPGDPYRCRPEAELLERIKKAAAPELERMGFSGSYPHYYRQRDKNMEYISFMLDSETDKPRRGSVSYYATVAAARLTSSQYHTLEQLGVPRDKANALDCLPEEIGLSDYGELAGASDAQYVRMDVNVYGGGRVTHDESGRLPRYIKLAEAQFLQGRIPARYRRLRLRAGACRGAWARSLAMCSPAGVITAVILLLIYNFRLRGQPGYTLSRELSAAAALACGAAVTGAAAFIRNLIRSFSLWRY